MGRGRSIGRAPSAQAAPLMRALRGVEGEAEQAGRPGDRADLEKHPRNGWCLLGLTQALEAPSLTDGADEARARFPESWVRSDAWIRGSRF